MFCCIKLKLIMLFQIFLIDLICLPVISKCNIQYIHSVTHDFSSPNLYSTKHIWAPKRMVTIYLPCWHHSLVYIYTKYLTNYILPIYFFLPQLLIIDYYLKWSMCLPWSVMPTLSLCLSPRFIRLVAYRHYIINLYLRYL